MKADEEDASPWARIAAVGRLLEVLSRQQGLLLAASCRTGAMAVPTTEGGLYHWGRGVGGLGAA